ncbi:MAG: hypothetical protein B7X90_07115 [Novosphingobium sp. 17-62-19]|uniref:FAS1-like dehydratase domain-containing protein n=1 Tax=Novosphingobium sp. 17-62-19 TaxID=1970406 RepID=UPI000BD2AF87|nr:MaoC family dehydratase N-terminal domain-containing protein [Novosphingobium sp. 17-62-19]OYX91119.1 MAG: hypothetical protein B7Y74_15185 [Novosphingobium sp. 35-62-5]OZA20012.1 MAG: hypothetical protein B7X90_07115 [Novosphingobium sp. 17-62-19]HQS95951.1 MaoC family dehydratase N-terminal domain-containing protein [Novosphingobium sp.]
MGEWDQWIGRCERRADRVDAGLVTRWLATLDRVPLSNEAVPQGLHWCLCLPDAPTARLGADGHPLRDESPGSFLPPMPLPRRMWASSEVEFLKPLRMGAAIERRSTVSTITEKHGGSGTLVFVDIAHETLCDDALAVREMQTVVYRDAATAGSACVPPALGEGRFDPAPWTAHRMVVPAEPQLFRFSALTFNSHRIHYDLPYAQSEEGYRGLVVHGPLTATLLLDLAQAELGTNALKSFAFRGLSPAICGEPLHLAMRGSGAEIELAAFAADGRPVMAASAAV